MIDHERAEELLAGYALDSLTGDDAREAEELLSEHVPRCLTCRRLLDGFREVAADLALAAAPSPAPDDVWHALRRSMEESDGLAVGGRRRLATWAAAAAAAVLVFALAGWNLTLNQRVSRTEGHLTAATSAMSAISDPTSRIVSLDARTRPARMAVVSVPGDPHVYLLGEMPRPARGRAYQVWFTKDGEPVWRSSTFVPLRRSVVIRLPLDLTDYDGVLVTEEPAEGSARPTGEAVMAASL